MIEARKVQRLGQTSLIVTLPKKWVNKVNLKPGDIVFMEIGDETLKITPKKMEREEGIVTYVINADLCKSPNMLERLLTACYLQGYDNIVVKSDSGLISPKHLAEVRRAITRHMGLSILEQKPDHIMIQCFIDPTRFPVNGLIRRLYSLIISMANFISEALGREDPSLLEEVAHLESEVDKFYWLLVRQLFLAQRNATIARQVGIPHPLHIVGNRVVVKVLEEAADSLYGAAEIMLKAWDMREVRETFKGFRELVEKLIVVAEDSMKAFFDLDVELANNIINEVKGMLGETEGRELLRVREPWKIVESIIFSKILGALDKFNVIAEITINRAAETESDLIRFVEQPQP